MSDSIHKTYPRLITTGTLFLWSFFLFGLTIAIGLKVSNSENSELSILYFILTASITLVSSFFLFKTKVILVSESQLIVSNFFFPKKQYFDLTEIRDLKQSKTTTTNYLGIYNSPFHIKRDSYRLNMYKTTIELNDKRQFTIRNISEMEFDLLFKAFSKHKRGEGKVKKPKGRWMMYLIDNLGGLFFNLLLSFLLGGLLISII
jgi:hypothetical protein